VRGSLPAATRPLSASIIPILYTFRSHHVSAQHITASESFDSRDRNTFCVPSSHYTLDTSHVS
jgi:hypothetical protein